MFGALTVAAAALIMPSMPYLLSFAAGAMLYVVVEELIPEMAAGEHSHVRGRVQSDDGAGCSTRINSKELALTSLQC